MFSIEQAHWHYLDYYCNIKANNKFLPKISLRKFAIQMLSTYSFLITDLPTQTSNSNTNSHSHNRGRHISPEDLDDPNNPTALSQHIDNLIADFQEYKRQVPTYGAILVDTTFRYCLMVRGANAKVSWGFPKGKRNKDETPETCAIREVKEEIGFDCTNLIGPMNAYLEANGGPGHHGCTRLFLVQNINLQEAKFFPESRNEIRDIRWFLIDELPDERKLDNGRVCQTYNWNSTNFFMAVAFITPLRKYCQEKRRHIRDQPSRSGDIFDNGNHVRSYDLPPMKDTANHEEVQDMLNQNNTCMHPSNVHASNGHGSNGHNGRNGIGIGLGNGNNGHNGHNNNRSNHDRYHDRDIPRGPKILSRDIPRKNQTISLDKLKSVCQDRKKKYQQESTEQALNSLNKDFDGNLLRWFRESKSLRSRPDEKIERCEAWENFGLRSVWK